MERIRGSYLELLYWRRELEEAVWSFYIGGEIWRKLFGALISMGRYYKGWRGLFRALITGEGSQDAYLELLYWRRDIIRSGGSCSELL